MASLNREANESIFSSLQSLGLHPEMTDTLDYGKMAEVVNAIRGVTMEY